MGNHPLIIFLLFRVLALQHACPRAIVVCTLYSVHALSVHARPVRQTSLQSHPFGVQAIGLVRLIPNNRFWIAPRVSVGFQSVLRSDIWRTHCD